MHGSPTTGYTSRHIRGISRHTCTWQVLAVVWVATALAAGGIGWLAGARGWHASSGTFSGSSSGRLADPGRASSTPCALAAGRAVTSVPMANEQPPLLRRPAVLLFGDSLTERCFDAEGGWGAALAHRLARKADVLSRGFGGYNSRWAALALEEVLSQLADARQRVLLATLWLGANDAALPDRSAARQHVPLAEFEAALSAMVDRMLAAGIPRVVLITPPPVYDEGRVRHQQQRMGTTEPVAPDRTDAHAARYAEAVRALGARRRLPVLDLHAALRREPGWQTALLADGLHFTPAGQALVGRLLVELLEREYPDELSLEKLPNQMPWWDKLADAGRGKDLELWRDFLRDAQQRGDDDDGKDGGSGGKNNA